MTDTKYCDALLFAGNRIDPPEYCDEEAVDGTDYCEKHAHAGDEYEGPEEDWND